MRSYLAVVCLTLCVVFGLSAAPLRAAVDMFTFASIDGGQIDLRDWKGRPVLVVNTASRCGYTAQYDGLQRLYDTYRDQGLIVLAVPSHDFRQELSSDAEVKAFCEVNFALDLPMTTITPVRGGAAHPFYQWLATEAGFTPRWNFNKVLLAPDGRVAATFGATTDPMSRPMITAITAFLK